MTTDELLRELRGVRSLIEQHEPDRRRTDWSGVASDLAALRQSLQTCSAQLPAVLAEIEGPGDRELVRTAVAECHAGGAALLAASRDEFGALQVVRRAIELAPPGGDLVAEMRAAEVSLDRFVDLTYGRRLWEQGHIARAASVLKGVAAGADCLASAARAMVDGPRPITSAPTLFTWNGIGLTVVGDRDRRGDGSYVKTHCLSIVFVPILPLAAYRVSDAGQGGYYFHSREKLSPLASKARFLVPLAILLLIAGASMNAYLGSTSRQVRKALEAAGELERAGQGDQALAAYDRAITDFLDDDSAVQLRSAAAGVVRLAAARVGEPVTAGSVETIRRVVLRYQELPQSLRAPPADAELRRRLVAWAGQIGSADLAARRASLRVLELAATAVVDDDVAGRVDGARAQLAAELAGERPIEALRQYAAVGKRRAATEPVAAILAGFEPGSSLWVEAEDEIGAWLEGAGDHPRAAEFRAQLDEVRKRERDPGRAELLGGDLAALTAAAAANPRDHGIAVALAGARREAGKIDEALAGLTALGGPGRLTAEAQAALGSLYADAGKLDDGERVLAALLTSELPVYQDAVSRYERTATSAQEALIAKARIGDLPSEVEAAARGASDEKQQEILQKWLGEEMEKDPRLARLAEEVGRRSHVVPAALTLGMIRLQQANAASGDARKQRLAGAEQAFLSVRSQAEGKPEFHLGLGQVYYRLGKPEDGERELARVLAEEDPRLRLQVGRVYRELGLTARAKQVAEAVYADAVPDEVKTGAAVLRSLVADNQDDEETWLSRADQKIPFVRRGLMSLQGERKLREGDAAGADELFATVADEYGKEAARDSAAANNAAVAEGQRFRCTGDIARLEKAAAYYAQSYRTQPDSAIVAGNLAVGWRQLAVARALGKWFELGTLRPTYGDAMEILDVLATGPERAVLRERLGADAAYRRSNDALRQWQILAPQNAETYGVEEVFLSLLDDGAGLASLRDRLGRVKLNQSTEYEAWISGSKDEERRKDVAETAARYQRTLAATRGDKRARAAVLILLAENKRVEALLGEAEAALGERERMLGEAAKLLPLAGVERVHAGARLSVAVMAAVAAAPEARAMWEAKRRTHGTVFLAHAMAQAAPAARDAIRSHPLLAGIKPVLERWLADGATFELWLFASAIGDADLERRVAEAMRRSNALVRAEVAAGLHPEYPSSAEALELIKKIVGR
jgi:cellulose synthase operon protein C